MKEYDDPVQKEISKSTRKNIRKALESGVEFNVTMGPEDFKEFKGIYYETMARNKADTYYYYDDVYFERINAYFGENILLVEAVYEGETIGMGVNFVYDNMIHTHLSGTLNDFRHLSQAYILQYALIVWGKENGVDLIHMTAAVRPIAWKINCISSKNNSARTLGLNFISKKNLESGNL